VTHIWSQQWGLRLSQIKRVRSSEERTTREKYLKEIKETMRKEQINNYKRKRKFSKRKYYLNKPSWRRRRQHAVTRD
jgi:hypothetical protein